MTHERRDLMQRFLDSYGAARAQVCLDRFSQAVKALAPGTLPASSRAVIDDELQALHRRMDAALAELAAERTQIEREGRALQRRFGAVQDGTTAQALAEHDEDTKALDHAYRWVADLAHSVTILAVKLDDPTAPEYADAVRKRLMRTISEISAVLDAMTVAGREAREGMTSDAGTTPIRQYGAQGNASNTPNTSRRRASGQRQTRQQNGQ